MSDHLPVEIVTRILVRLPAISLPRCRCVSKQWRSLIDSPSFTKLQIDHSTAATANATLLIFEDEGELFSKVLPDGLRRQTSIRFGAPYDALPAPGVNLFGSCHGLLCFSQESQQALIVNPLTKKWHFTPTLRPENFHLSAPSGTLIYETGYGFGYDSVSDDYKVVRIFHMLDPDKVYLPSKLVHFGVRSNSSKMVEFPYILYQKIGAVAGGAFHWVVSRYDDRPNPKVKVKVVAFDLGVGKCKEIPQPKYAKGGGGNLRAGELNECLCIFDNCMGRFVDVWIMKEYGVEESWIKLFSIPHPRLSYEEGIRNLGFSVTGREILLQLDDKKLVWYDVKKGSVEEVTIRGLKKKKYMDAVVCFGSLVSPDGKYPPAELKTEKPSLPAEVKTGKPSPPAEVKTNTPSPPAEAEVKTYKLSPPAEAEVKTYKLSPPAEAEVKTDKQKKNKKRDDFLSTGFKLDGKFPASKVKTDEQKKNKTRDDSLSTGLKADGKSPPAQVIRTDEQKKNKKRDDFLSSGFKLKL